VLQVSLSGQLVGGPAASGGTNFPSGVKTITFNLLGDPLGYQVETGDVISVNSAGAFVTIPGVGTVGGFAGPVTQGLVLYISTAAPIKIRKTMADIAGGSDIVSIDEISGPLVQQFPSNGYLKLLEVQGVATVEFHVWGNQ
jgi:hypothetical protein